jgi:hypothetical protein
VNHAKHRRKTANHAAKEAHLRAVPHPGMVEHGFWMKWRRRFLAYIEPYYRSRGLLTELSAAQLHAPGRSLHPIRLPAEATEPALFRHRVDEVWAAEHPPPAWGDLVVARGDRPEEPFWVGIVRLINGQPKPSLRRGEEPYVDPQARPAAAADKSAPSAKAAKGARLARGTAKQVAYVEEDEEEVDDGDYDDAASVGGKRKAGKAAAAPPAKKGKRGKSAPVVESAAAAADDAAPAAPAAAGSAAGSSAGGSDRMAVEAPASAAPELEYTVHWYGFIKTTLTDELRLYDPEAHAAAVLEADGPLGQWQAYVSALASKQFARVPTAVVDRWRECTYKLLTLSHVPRIGTGKLTSSTRSSSCGASRTRSSPKTTRCEPTSSARSRRTCVSRRMWRAWPASLRACSRSRWRRRRSRNRATRSLSAADPVDSGVDGVEIL